MVSKRNTVIHKSLWTNMNIYNNNIIIVDINGTFSSRNSSSKIMIAYVILSQTIIIITIYYFKKQKDICYGFHTHISIKYS